MNNKPWETFESELVQCRICPRLVAWRELVAKEKRRAYLGEDYWGKPVPGFGDHDAQILIVGLAPGAHGSNRTGRMFTGDASGDFLFPALYESGFSTQPNSSSMQDEMKLKNAFITAVCRCAPPNNKPTRIEQINCRKFMLAELELLKNLKGIVALGGIAFDSVFDILKTSFNIRAQRRPKFEHGKIFQWESCPLWVLSSYHPSRQNTQTGRLTFEMFSTIWLQANQLIDR